MAKCENAAQQIMASQHRITELEGALENEKTRFQKERQALVHEGASWKESHDNTSTRLAEVEREGHQTVLARDARIAELNTKLSTLLNENQTLTDWYNQLENDAKELRGQLENQIESIQKA